VILPDYLAPGLRVVFCGTAAGEKSAERGHYYAGRGNEFWKLLFESHLTSSPLSPEMDSRVTEFEVGLTDLAKLVASSSDAKLRAHYDVEGFVRKIETFKPYWVAFHGKTAAKVVARALGHTGDVRLGYQAWYVADRPVFVLPSASGSNRDPRRLEGKATRLEWFRELARHAFWVFEPPPLALSSLPEPPSSRS
jgi:TDG/mug DNA glycosylase family protein